MEAIYLNGTDKDSSGVYRILNLESKKLYVGATTNGFHYRLWKHRSALRKGNHGNRHLQNSFDKHGEKAFLFQGLFEAEGKEAFEKEQEILDSHLEDGFEVYNIALEVEHTGGWTPTEEQRQKYIEHIKNIWEDKPEHMAEQARKNPIKYTDEKLRDPNGDIQEITEGVNKFANERGINSSRLYSLLKGELKSYKGWTNPEYDFSAAELRNIYGFYEVRNVDTSETFSASSTRALADKIGVNNPVISKLSRNPGYVHKDTWTITDKVLPNKTYEEVDHLDGDLKSTYEIAKHGQNGGRETYRGEKFIDPQGYERVIKQDISTFCNKHGLPIKEVKTLLDGTRDSYRGWVYSDKEFSQSELRRIRSFYLAKNIYTGEIRLAKSQSQLSEKIDYTAVSKLNLNKIKVNSDGWTLLPLTSEKEFNEKSNIPLDKIK